MFTPNTPDFSLTSFNIDEQWYKLPTEFDEWLSFYAEINNKVDELKKQLEEKDAELDLYFREQWDSLFAIKMTETAISKEIIDNKSRKDISERLLSAKKKQNNVKSIVSKLDHKEKALEYLSKLYLGNYFVKTGENEATKEIADGASKKEMNQKTKDTLKRRRENRE